MGRSSDKTSKKGPVLLLLILIIAVGLLVFARTSYFNITDIEVNGNSFVSDEEIVDYADLSRNMNYFDVRMKDAIERLNAHPYILEANIERKIPDSIVITVNERDLAGYIPFMGSFLLIDSEGRVISAAAGKPVKELPVFRGIPIENFQIQEVLEVDNMKIFDKIIYISQNIVENINGYGPVEVDVENMEDITIELDGRFVIKLGGTAELDYKLKYSNTILEKLYPQDVGGEIDVSCGERAFFRPW
jgi:cell division protein FtsQ